MRKMIMVLLISVLAFTLAACNDGKKEDKEAKNSTKTEENTKSEEELAAEAEELQKKLDKQKVEEDIVVAIVNGKEIKGTEYNQILTSLQTSSYQNGLDPTSEETAKQLKEETLNSIVGQELLMQEINKKGYTASEDEINKQLETEKARFEKEEDFEKALESSKLTIDDLKEQIKENVIISQYLEKDMKVDEVKEEEVKELYTSLTKNLDDSSETPKYEDVKESLKEKLVQDKTAAAIRTKIEELRKNAEVELKI
ncbi:SurA N-terminal domain-containing protein [Metabacillus malikii]|uniref:Peptidylprolyl isomerase n=1 Tax=Metabacillus malikii TaxID=1504265 RepID=A0ABT9ZAX9_9BACI|nr:SurA N-terminal domain-containing protein [Metabacillus malikii]MDQ0229419.1 hypothetical protein [Metabacillus malikii]